MDQLLRENYARWAKCAALCGILLVGCEQSAPPPTVQEVHLKQLAVLYGQYTSSHAGQGPKNEADFKAFIKKRAPKLSEEEIAALFVSPRDQKPYIVAYSVRASLGQTAAPVVAFEEIGIEGKHFAADMLGGVEEIDQAELQNRALKKN